jgi:hypothetical protein
MWWTAGFWENRSSSWSTKVLPRPDLQYVKLEISVRYSGSVNNNFVRANNNKMQGNTVSPCSMLPVMLLAL